MYIYIYIYIINIMYQEIQFAIERFQKFKLQSRTYLQSVYPKWLATIISKLRTITDFLNASNLNIRTASKHNLPECQQLDIPKCQQL